jgi:hypothetical protein
MTWNWQQSDWPKFRWDATRLSHAEERFLLVAGVAIGTARHLGEDDRRQVLVELMSGEAVTTSAIEGEVLSRASVQFSIQRQLGLATESRRVTPAEQGVAEMMVDLFRSHAEPLTRNCCLDASDADVGTERSGTRGGISDRDEPVQGANRLRSCGSCECSLRGAAFQAGSGRNEAVSRVV